MFREGEHCPLFRWTHSTYNHISLDFFHHSSWTAIQNSFLPNVLVYWGFHLPTLTLPTARLPLTVSKHIPRNPPSPSQQQEVPASPATNGSNECVADLSVEERLLGDCRALEDSLHQPQVLQLQPFWVVEIPPATRWSHPQYHNAPFSTDSRETQQHAPTSMDLLLLVTTNMVESTWDYVFGNQMAISMKRIIHTATVLPFIPFTHHQSLWGSFQPPVLCLKQGQLEWRQNGALGKPNPSNPNTGGLLLPGGHYKDCQKQWKCKIQTDCLCPCTHENHSSSIINALGLICQDFGKTEFKTKKTSNIFMIMPACLWDGRLVCTLCFFPANPSSPF